MRCLLAGLVLSLAACGNDGLSADDLRGEAFRIESVDGVAVDGATPGLLQFSSARGTDGMIDGLAVKVCGTVGGDYRIDGGTLRWEPRGSEGPGCDDRSQAIARQVVTLLEGGPTIEVENELLVLRSDGQELHAVRLP